MFVEVSRSLEYSHRVNRALTARCASSVVATHYIRGLTPVLCRNTFLSAVKNADAIIWLEGS